MRPTLATSCSVEGCERGGKIRRGFCEMHYYRWRRHGDPGCPGLLVGNPQHGTYNMYANHGCRCDECRAIATTMRRIRRQRAAK